MRRPRSAPDEGPSPTRPARAAPAGVIVAALLAVLVSACTAGDALTLPAPGPSTAPSVARSAPSPERTQPAGEVRVAYPAEPAAWHPSLLAEPAAVDLAALWGLPLYRIDGAGQLRPVLAAEAEVVGELANGDWSVEIGLREGRWSDGSPVVAEDVVATLKALRDAPRGRGLQPLVRAEAVEEHRVRLVFDRPYARWPYLLAGGRSVVPASELEESGLAAYQDGVPVAGGQYELAAWERGRRAVFEARGAGPLPPPGIARVVVDFVPAYETALGLLQEGRVDVVLGHLALNPVERARRLEGVDAAAPLGGTWLDLRWRAGGAYGGFEEAAVRRRRNVRDAVDLTRLVEGLLGDVGAVAAATVPGIDGPWGGPAGIGRISGQPEPTVLVSRWEEAPAFTVRALQRELEARASGMEIVRLEPDDLARRRSGFGDGAVLVRRDSPRPSLLGRLADGAPDSLVRLATLADAAGRADDATVDRVQLELHDVGHDLPLYRIAAAHAWDRAVGGIEPSSWPGLGLWNVGEWRLRDDPEHGGGDGGSPPGAPPSEAAA